MAGSLIGNEVYIVPSSGPKIPLEFMAAVTVEMSRGFEADALKFLTSDKRFDSIGSGPCSIEFTTPVDFGKGPKVWSWRGWYMSSIQPNSQRPGSYIVTMHDFRFKAARAKVTVSYNVQWPDTKARLESKTSVGGRGDDWTCLNAAIDALTKFGFEVDDISKHVVSPEQREKVLPYNLGNSDGGGWFAASLDEMLPALLEPIRCDLVMTPEGKARIVSRSGADDSPKLEAHHLIAGVVGERNIKWQLPPKVVVLFERLAEGAWELLPERSSAGTIAGSGSGLNWEVTNVMPEFNDGKPTGEYVNLGEQLVEHFDVGHVESYLGRRWFKAQLFPYRRDVRTRNYIGMDPQVIARDVAKRSWFDDMTRQCWRRLYSVGPKAFSNTSYARYFTNIRLGRLEKNGGTKDGGNVWCNYVKHLRWGRLPIGAKDDSPLNNIFSENHFFGDPLLSTPSDFYSYNAAPFSARWVSAEKLIFEVRPDRPDNIEAKSVFPGTMKEHLNYGPLFKLVSGTAMTMTEVNGELKGADPRTGKGNFAMRVVYNGRVSRDMPSGFIGEPGDRAYRVEKDAFPGGMGRPVEVRAGETVTANFGLTDAAMRRPINGSLMADISGTRELLNPDEIDDVAEFITEQVMQTCVQNRAGTATVEGVSAPAAGIWTGGLIYKMSVVIGQDMNESVLVNYVVQPEVRDIETSREKAAKAPRRAVEE